MKTIDRRTVLGAIVGVTAAAGAVAMTATSALALPKALPATGEGRMPDSPSAHAGAEPLPPVEKARWWIFGRRRRRSYGYGRRRW